jgi:hypothetical protein
MKKMKRTEMMRSLASQLVSTGGTLFGGYVYKTIINGDQTADLDVIGSIEKIQVLLENYGCLRERDYYNYQRYICQTNENAFHVDLFESFQLSDSPPAWFIYNQNGLNCIGGNCARKFHQIKTGDILDSPCKRQKDWEYFQLVRRRYSKGTHSPQR